MIKPPTQPLPWSVREQIRGYTTGDEPDFVILDANGLWVASFGPVRGEAEFVVEVANAWGEKQKRRRKR